MTRSPHWIQANKQIRAAEKALGMTREDHKALVYGLTGRHSLAQCTTAEMWTIRDHLNDRTAPAYRPASRPEIRKMWALWGELGRRGALETDPAARRQALVDHVNAQTGKTLATPEQLDWLTAVDIAPVIEGLKAWIARVQTRQTTHV